MESNQSKSLLSILGMMVLIPLSMTTAYHIAGPNPNDWLEVELLTKQFDLDSPDSNQVLFRITNRSPSLILVNRLEADFGCKVLMQPSDGTPTLVPGQTCEVGSSIDFDHAFLLPRTKSEVDLPLSTQLVVEDEAGRRHGLPSERFNLRFFHRVIANTDLIRLASEPRTSDVVGSTRKVVLRTAGHAQVTSVQADPSQTLHGLVLETTLQPGAEGTSVVTLNLHSDEADESGTWQHIDTHLEIETQLPGQSDSTSVVRIPIRIQKSWN